MEKMKTTQKKELLKNCFIKLIPNENRGKCSRKLFLPILINVFLIGLFPFGLILLSPYPSSSSSSSPPSPSLPLLFDHYPSMELESSWLLHTLYAFCFILVFIIIVSPRFALFLYLLLLKLWCNCEICDAYLNLSWAKSFDNLCDWYAHLLKHSPTKTIPIHVLGNIITANPENIKYMLKTRFDNYPKGKPFSLILGDFLGRGIFNVDGDMWRFQKNMASLELDRLSIRSNAFEIVRCEIGKRLLPLLVSFSGKEDGILDLQDVFRRFSFDSICQFSFGLDPKCLQLSLPMSEFAVAFDLASKFSAERAMAVSPLVWKIKRKLNIGSEKKMKEAIKIIDILAQEVMRQKRVKGFSTHKDLLSRFMRTVDDETYLRDIVISFLLAGRDTVASALTSFFWLLAKHPEIGSAIQVEADRVLGPNQEPKSFEEIQQLHYLQAAVHESMRLYPPIQFDSKFCQQDDVLPDGTFVKRGTRVTYHPYAMGRMEEIWGPDCLEFKPERWLRDGVFFSENPYKYPIFQGGFRVCLGKEMALMEIKSVCLSLLQRFHFKLVFPCHSTPRFSPGLTSTFRDGLLVLVREKVTQLSHRNYMVHVD